MDERVREIVSAQLRATVRAMDAADLIVQRQRLIDETLAASGPEVVKLGARLSEVNPQAVEFDEESEFYQQLKRSQAMITRRNSAAGRPGE